MKYDLIIVAASKDLALTRMTQEAIDSCLEDKADVNVILVETYRKTPYKNVDFNLFYNKPFNYNGCLNMGLKYRTGDIQILANNDIVFLSGWSTIGETMQRNGFLSASALSSHPRQRAFKRGDYAYAGYEICMYMTGWCIFVDKSVWDKIGELDESYTFWYSDNMYINQIASQKIQHYLICNVQVNHHLSRTLMKQDHKTRQIFTNAERKDIQKRDRPHLQKKF
jgi:hypothetical protein